MSNVLGTINPIKEIADLCHGEGRSILLVVDGAQAVGHMPVDVKELDIDFYACSGHKMYGPEGIGVLYGKRELLEKLEPSAWGGEMVREVKLQHTSWNDLPYKFEPGTPDITQAIGLGAAVVYLEKLGMHEVRKRDHTLTTYALQQLRKEGVVIIGPQTAAQRSGAIAFVVEGVHAHDVAEVLGEQGICVRAGNHCAQPLHCELGLDATVRISFGIYSTASDVDAFIKGLRKAREVFK